MAQLPIVTLNGHDHFADLRLREFRAVNDPHIRISYFDVLGNPDAYTFSEPIQPGKTVAYLRNAAGLLTVAVRDMTGRETFDSYPRDVRVQARACLFLQPSLDEVEKLAAATVLPRPYQRLVWDDLLCARADRIRAAQLYGHMSYPVSKAKQDER